MKTCALTTCGKEVIDPINSCQIRIGDGERLWFCNPRHRYEYEHGPFDLIDHIAKMISGLSVPVSMGMPLGLAKDGWTGVREDLNLFGWNTEEEIAEALRKRLQPVE